MRAGNFPDTKYNVINSNVRMHEIDISKKPIRLLNNWILNYFVLRYFSFNGILQITFCDNFRSTVFYKLRLALYFV